MNGCQFSNFFLVCMLVAIDAPSSRAATSIYADRAQFEERLSVMIVDDYENNNYQDENAVTIFSIHSNADMNAVLNETRYTPTAWPQQNHILLWNMNTFDHMYDSSFNGSFRLDFTQSSITRGNGVDGFGVDFANYGFDFQPELGDFAYYAYVTFGDDTTANYKLPTTATGFINQKFFGVISDKQIASVHFGEFDGAALKRGTFAIDNLTIGLVPEPSTFAMIFSGMAMTLIVSCAKRAPR
jgi:hypothetical protein